MAPFCTFCSLHTRRCPTTSHARSPWTHPLRPLLRLGGAVRGRGLPRLWRTLVGLVPVGLPYTPCRAAWGVGASGSATPWGGAMRKSGVPGGMKLDVARKLGILRCSGLSTPTSSRSPICRPTSRPRDVTVAVLVQLERHNEHPRVRRRGYLPLYPASQHQPADPCTTLDGGPS